MAAENTRACAPRPSARMLRMARQQRGMTLIEAMVSIVLLSIGVVGLLGLLATASRSGDDAQDRNRAALLANELATAMWMNNATDVTQAPLSNAYQAWLNTAGTPTNGKGLNLATPPTVTLNGAIATITISWKPPGRSGTATGTENSYDVQAATHTYTTQVALP